MSGELKYQLSDLCDWRELAMRTPHGVYTDLVAACHAEHGISAATHTPFYESEHDPDTGLTRFTVTLYPNALAPRIAARLRKP